MNSASRPSGFMSKGRSNDIWGGLEGGTREIFGWAVLPGWCLLDVSAFGKSNCHPPPDVWTTVMTMQPADAVVPVDGDALKE